MSTQVLQELAVNLRRKAALPLDPKATREIVADYLTWQVVVNWPMDKRTVPCARSIHCELASDLKRRPAMAMVILFGLFSSTALNMIVVPVLYERFGRHPEVA